MEETCLSVRERALDLSKRLAATDSDISFQAVYRELWGRTVAATQGTITDNYRNIHTRCYLETLGMRELAAGAGVVERGDLIFRFSEDKLTPRSEEDEVYLDQYHWGSISINRNATRLTGASVSWAVIEPDDRLRLAAQGTFHRVASVVNTAGTMVLSEAYGNATLTGATYRIYRPYQVIAWERAGHQAEWKIQGRRI